MENQKFENLNQRQSTTKVKLRLWLKMLKTTRYIINELSKRLKQHYNTTLPQFDVLAALSKNQTGLRMTEISEELKVSNGNITGIIDRLVMDGLVIRTSVQGDRRATIITLTPKGEEHFNKIAKDHEKWLDEIMGEISPEQLQNALQVFKDVRIGRKIG